MFSSRITHIFKDMFSSSSGFLGINSRQIRNPSSCYHWFSKSFIIVDTITQNDSSYYGAIVGRVANRIGGAQFTLNGTHYKLAHNDGRNTLHGTSKHFFLLTCISQFVPSFFPLFSAIIKDNFSFLNGYLYAY